MQAVLTLLPLRAVNALRALSACVKPTPKHVFDLAMVTVWGLACYALVHVQAGAIYFWMKDITPEFLKIHALYGALDIFEKVRPPCAQRRHTSTDCTAMGRKACLTLETGAAL